MVRIGHQLPSYYRRRPAKSAKRRDSSAPVAIAQCDEQGGSGELRGCSIDIPLIPLRPRWQQEKGECIYGGLPSLSNLFATPSRTTASSPGRQTTTFSCP